MGIFGGYMKEGPGVDKNAPKKKGFFLYVDIVVRKFMNLMSSGFLHTIFSLLFLAVCYMFVSTYIISGLGLTEAMETAARNIADASENVDYDSALQMMYFSIRALISVFLFNFFGSGPVSAAYAYVTRCYTRGEHVWMMSDGWDKFKENFKHSIILIIVDIFVLCFTMLSIAMTPVSEMTGMTAKLMIYSHAGIMVALVIYMMMHIYIYQIMVTYECTFIELIKTSIVIAIAKLPMSVLLVALTGFGVVFLMSMISNPLAGLILYSVLSGIFLRYPLEFYAARVIERNIKVSKKNENKKNAKVTYIDEASL